MKISTKALVAAWFPSLLIVEGSNHPIQSLDDPRLKNPWAGAPVPVPVASKKRQLQGKPTSAGPRATAMPTPNQIWHAIIVGAGPGGCSAAHTLVDEGVDPSMILVLERGPSLQAFKDKGYGNDATTYGVSQSDPDFREDIDGTPIVLGTGVGGGTNHFGMQFIDQLEVSDASSRQPVTGSNITADVDVFTAFSGATTYTDQNYVNATVDASFANLYAKIDDKMNGIGKSYRNKVYKTGTDLENQPRLMVGDLIPEDVVVQAETEVTSLVPGDDMQCVETTKGRYCALHVLLAANPLNSVRLALNAQVLPRSGKSKGTDYRSGLWDHQGFVMNYFPPNTGFDPITPPPITDDNKAGLTVYGGVDSPVQDAIAGAREDYPSAGFIAYLTVNALTQAQVNAILGGTWNEPDPVGSNLISYMFDLGSFFSSGHPGGNREAIIEANGFDIGKTIVGNAAESHKDLAIISRILRAGGSLLGIYDNRQIQYAPNFSAVTGTFSASSIIGHVQSRPDDHKWQYYFVSFPFPDYLGNMGELIVGVSTTGEQIQNDGRVYAGEAVNESTVKLPTFGNEEFAAVKDGLDINNEILMELGWMPLSAVPATIEEMVGNASFLPTTYHYHGMMCPSEVTLSAGFHACDLSRMCRKWAGSTSVASGGMGVQCGKEVAADLAAAGLFA